MLSTHRCLCGATLVDMSLTFATFGFGPRTCGAPNQVEFQDGNDHQKTFDRNALQELDQLLLYQHVFYC